LYRYIVGFQIPMPRNRICTAACASFLTTIMIGRFYDTVHCRFPNPNAAQQNLHRCMRFLPHHNDDGGFFVAILRKTRALDWPKKTYDKQLKKNFVSKPQASTGTAFNFYMSRFCIFKPEPLFKNYEENLFCYRTVRYHFCRNGSSSLEISGAGTLFKQGVDPHHMRIQIWIKPFKCGFGSNSGSKSGSNHGKFSEIQIKMLF
jgi:hypothetical protein